MKISSRRWFLPVICIAALTTKGNSDPAPQPQLEFTKGLEGTFNADWEGVAGRTYFMQFSLDLVEWTYAPFMHFGENSHHRGIHSTSDKLFLRLHYIDSPGINSLEDAMNADYDGDGLNNAFEIMNGLNPFKIDSNDDGIADGAGDADEDGTLSINEQILGRDPKVKDNPAVKLSVVVGN